MRVMNAGKSYAEPVPVGGVMEGGTVSVVDEQRQVSGRRYPRWALRLAELCRFDGTSLGKVDPGAAPISTALGVLGMPGLTAYSGLLRLGKPKEAEIVGRQPPVRSAPMSAKSPRSKLSRRRCGGWPR